MLPLRPLAGGWSAHLRDDSWPMSRANHQTCYSAACLSTLVLLLSLSLFFFTPLGLSYICNTSLFFLLPFCFPLDAGPHCFLIFFSRSAFLNYCSSPGRSIWICIVWGVWLREPAQGFGIWTALHIDEAVWQTKPRLSG